MMCRLGLAVLFACFTLSLASVTVRAEKIDIKAVTCGQLKGWKTDDKYDVFVFMLGYYGGMTKSVEIDDDIIETFAKKFDAWCSSHPDAKLLENIRTVIEAR